MEVTPHFRGYEEGYEDMSKLSNNWYCLPLWGPHKGKQYQLFDSLLFWQQYSIEHT